MPSLSDKIKRYRIENGLTQEELGKRLFVSRQAVSKWEQGRGYPSLPVMESLAKLLNVTLDGLISQEDSKLISLQTSGSAAIARKNSFIAIVILAVIAVSLITALIIVLIPPPAFEPAGIVGFYIDLDGDGNIVLGEENLDDVYLYVMKTTSSLGRTKVIFGNGVVSGLTSIFVSINSDNDETAFGGEIAGTVMLDEAMKDYAAYVVIDDGSGRLTSKPLSNYWKGVTVNSEVSSEEPTVSQSWWTLSSDPLRYTTRTFNIYDSYTPASYGGSAAQKQGIDVSLTFNTMKNFEDVRLLQFTDEYGKFPQYYDGEYDDTLISDRSVLREENYGRETAAASAGILSETKSCALYVERISEGKTTLELYKAVYPGDTASGVVYKPNEYGYADAPWAYSVNTKR